MTTKEFIAAEVFNLPAAKMPISGYSKPGPMTPMGNPSYRFRPELLRDVLCWHQGILAGQHNDGLWLTGPMSAGKSSIIVEMGARLNLNVVQVNGKRRLEVNDLIGQNTLIDGDVLFQDGPLTTAMRNGWYLLINEVDLIDPGELAGLNTILDGGSLTISENGGEVIQPVPGFGLICTANTVGLGDSAGLYVGTQRMNAALLDRFWVIEVDYPDSETEQSVIANAVPGMPGLIIEKMIEVAGEVRRLFAGDGEGMQVETTFSTRTLIRWAYLAQQFRKAEDPMVYALERALLNRAEPETAEAVKGIVQRVFGGATAHEPTTTVVTPEVDDD